MWRICRNILRSSGRRDLREAVWSLRQQRRDVLYFFMMIT